MAGVKALHAGMRRGVGMSMVDSLPELKILEKLDLSLPELNLEIPELDLNFEIPELDLKIGRAHV